MEASPPGLVMPAPLGGGVGLDAFSAEPVLSSLAFLLTESPFEDLDDVAVGVVGFSPVMEASNWPIWIKKDEMDQRGRIACCEGNGTVTTSYKASGQKQGLGWAGLDSPA